jgi:hypothetical protein
MFLCRRRMDEKTEIVQEPVKMAKTTNSCSGCSSKINTKQYIKNKDPIANCLLRLCAIINGTWNDILASIQSISFLRDTALYIDCTILAIWKRRRTGGNRRKH